MKLRTFVLVCSWGMAFQGVMDLAMFQISNYHAPAWTLGVAWLYTSLVLYLVARRV